MCDEIVDAEIKTVTQNFNEKNAICKTKNFFILLAFLLIMIALLIAVSIYCYLINYKAKQKHILPFYITNYKLKKFCIDEILSKWRVKMYQKKLILKIVRVIILMI